MDEQISYFNECGVINEFDDIVATVGQLSL
jgi:hypothetical protein